MAGLGAIVAVAATVHVLLRGQPMLVDEMFHFDQVSRYLTGNPIRNAMLSMPTTYHLLMAVTASMLGISSLDAVRLLNLGVSLGFVALFYAAARQRDPDRAPLRTLQCFFLPVLLPLFFLVYTDPAALLVLMAAMLAHGNRRSDLAGLFGFVAVLVRHTNIFFCLLLAAWTWLDEQRRGTPVAGRVRAVAPFAPSLVLLAYLLHGFGGVVAGDSTHHPFGLFTGNLMLTVLMLAAFFLPAAIATLRDATRQQVVRTAGLSAVLGLLFLVAFPNDHPYNHVDYYVRNIVMYHFTKGFAWRLLFLPVVVAASWLLVTDPLEGPDAWVAYPVGLMYVLPIWLVEPRFCLVPLVLFLLLRRQWSRPVEYGILAVEVACSGWFVTLMLSRPHHPYFP